MILNKFWFPGHDRVGVIITQDETTGEKKASIGIGFTNVDGMDAQFIAEHGAPINKEQLQQMLDALK